MKAIRITSTEQDLYLNRLIIKFGKHTIVLPNETYKRKYLGKRRYRELMSLSTTKEVDLKYTYEYKYHIPKKIKDNIILQKTPKIQPVKNQVVTEEIKKPKSFLQSLFGI